MSMDRLELAVATPMVCGACIGRVRGVVELGMFENSLQTCIAKLSLLNAMVSKGFSANAFVFFFLPMLFGIDVKSNVLSG